MRQEYLLRHTQYALERVGEAQIKIFEEQDVNLDKVYIDHSDDSVDFGYLTGMLEKGVWLGIDHLTHGYRDGLPSLDQRLETVMQLVDRGFANRLMFGYDWAVDMPIFDSILVALRDEYNPKGYAFFRIVIPKLLDMGVSGETIRQVTVENPRRFLESGV